MMTAFVYFPFWARWSRDTYRACGPLLPSTCDLCTITVTCPLVRRSSHVQKVGQTICGPMAWSIFASPKVGKCTQILVREVPYFLHSRKTSLPTSTPATPIPPRQRPFATVPAWQRIIQDVSPNCTRTAHFRPLRC
jgi:hypothetical protein